MTEDHMLAKARAIEAELLNFPTTSVAEAGMMERAALLIQQMRTRIKSLESPWPRGDG